MQQLNIVFHEMHRKFSLNLNNIISLSDDLTRRNKLFST